MLFKDLKPGYPVYMLIKEDGIKSVLGKVINVSKPYLPTMQQGQMNAAYTAQMGVDVTIEAEGKTKTYFIPETLSVTYTNNNNIVISTDKEGILKDVEATKNQSLEIVNSVEKHKTIVEGCDRILEEWNPAFAEKKEQEKRISGLENEVKGLSKMLADFINEFKK